MNNVDYTDPTQTLPLPPPKLCKINHTAVDTDNNKEKSTNCMPC